MTKTTKTDAHRLDHVIAAALLLQRNLPASSFPNGNVDAHDTGLQRAAEALGHSTERKDRSIMGKPYSVTKIDLDHVKITFYSLDDSDRTDLGNHPSINTLDAAEQAADAAEQAAAAPFRVDPTPTPAAPFRVDGAYHQPTPQQIADVDAAPFRSEAVPEEITDEDHEDCDDEDCQRCHHVAALAERERNLDHEAAMNAAGAQRMTTILGLTDADLDDRAPDSIGGE